ncbi:SPW repeat protein [Nonomuraea sp. NPDC050153]|uniref:SPW repeat protein n=1 Tax=Nonomuraea sp. NPDC050153 TaxID=3364359 RepID=UPI0037B4A961
MRKVVCDMAESPLHPKLDMGQHPDIAALRAQYDMAAESPSGQSVSGLTFLSGLYLAISPWVVGFFGHTTLTVNNLITGIALALLAAGIASAYGRVHGLAWVIPIIGVWTIIAPWVLPPHGASGGTIINNVITGIVIAACGLACVVLGTMSKHRR